MTMWKQATLYGLLLALGTFALQWLDYQRMARVHAGDIYDFLLAAGFLALGLWIGARVLGRRVAPPAFDGNPRALAELGISPRELAVLREIAAGHSNKQIAAHLHVSPNTVKTHVARLFDKLGAAADRGLAQGAGAGAGPVSARPSGRNRPNHPF